MRQFPTDQESFFPIKMILTLYHCVGRVAGALIRVSIKLPFFCEKKKKKDPGPEKLNLQKFCKNTCPDAGELRN